MYNVGIDAGSKELVMVIRYKVKNHKAGTFNNTPDDHAKIVKTLSAKKGELRICLEATGIYHFDLAIALSRENLMLMVVNPKAEIHYFEALMTRSKTDPVDAGVLARYAEAMPFKAWPMPDKKTLQLRAFSRTIAAPIKFKAQTKNSFMPCNQATRFLKSSLKKRMFPLIFLNLVIHFAPVEFGISNSKAA